MKKNKEEYEIGKYKFKLIDDVNDGFILDEVVNKYTDYFDEFDYVVGDWSYGKLRLKGFCRENNKRCNKINNFKDYKKYIEEECAYGCKYFVLEKVEKS